MHVTLAKPFIVADTSTATAERLLDDAIGRNKRGMRSFVTDENDMAAIWHWDDAAKKLTATRYPIAEAQTIWSARLAVEYARLRPDQRLVQCQALVLGLEADALTGRRTPAVDKLLAEADGEMLNMVLAASMRHDFPRAAVAAADRLGKLGDTTVLYTVSPNAAPLAEALDLPEPPRPLRRPHGDHDPRPARVVPRREPRSRNPRLFRHRRERKPRDRRPCPSPPKRPRWPAALPRSTSPANPPAAVRQQSPSPNTRPTWS